MYYASQISSFCCCYPIAQQTTFITGHGGIISSKSEIYLLTQERRKSDREDTPDIQGRERKRQQLSKIKRILTETTHDVRKGQTKKQYHSF